MFAAVIFALLCFCFVFAKKSGRIPKISIQKYTNTKAQEGLTTVHKHFRCCDTKVHIKKIQTSKMCGLG